MDWEEIEKLAADFQNAQVFTDSQWIGEEDCKWIINDLKRRNRLNLITKNNEKEFITKEYLKKQIMNELSVNGGSMYLNELAEFLKVDLDHINVSVSEILTSNLDYHLFMGHLCSKEYVAQIVKNINDNLQHDYYVNVADLSLRYNMSAEFIKSTIENAAITHDIPNIQASSDKEVYYTKQFINKCKLKLRGALSAVTRPIALSVISKECSIPDSVIFSILNTLKQDNALPGIIKGNKTGIQTATFTPFVYKKNQILWIQDFYQRNDYLDCDTLKNLGILDAKSLIKKYFPNEDVIMLNSVVVSSNLVNRIKLLATNHEDNWIYVKYDLPSGWSEEDKSMFWKKISEECPVYIVDNEFMYPHLLLQRLIDSCQVLAKREAEMAVTSGKWMQLICKDRINLKEEDLFLRNNKVQKKEERRKKAATGKLGGGTQGRETKTKSTKKKYLQQNHNKYESDDDSTNIEEKNVKHELVSVEAIEKEIIGKLKNVNDTPVHHLAKMIHPKINEKALLFAEELAQHNDISSTNELKQELILLITMIKMFDQGIELFTSQEQRVSLTDYLMKSLCRDFTTKLFKLAAQQNKVQYSDKLDFDGIKKHLPELPSDVQVPFDNLCSCLTKKLIKEFLDCATEALPTCSIIEKKHNKYINKEIIASHKSSLLKELQMTEDPALALSLVTSFIFTDATGNILHMSGRHVTTVLSFLQPFLSPDSASQLNKYCDLVRNSLNSSNAVNRMEAQEALKNELEQIKLLPNSIVLHI